MKKNEDGSWDLSEAELLLQEWYNSLLDSGHSHPDASQQILLRTPTNGVAWKLLADMDLRKHLAGIRIWGPLAKDDHVVTDETLPRIEFLDDDGNRKSEAGVRRLGPDLYVVKDPDCDIEHLMTTQEIKEDDYVRFVPESEEA